ncbi:hypothetical protein NW754_015760 [Fusarium falciforme]|uniref:Uncharacterized protein n=1 Tax=Fusarium falciforme TaxID=195108 RepID=A0A9W8V624_9HYPO|nr:hypothetical protein NW754_015760 [Fusarium falciforme]KAJ4194330.1 hypothetical protein NW755_003087 [Fusarium falciforme]
METSSSSVTVTKMAAGQGRGSQGGGGDGGGVHCPAQTRKELKEKSHRSAVKFWWAVVPLKLVKASGRDHSVRSFLGLDAEEWGVLAVSACSFVLSASGIL